jgi:D-alanine-D-alanine ligase
MPRKLNVGVLFGGRSAEHQVSLVSAASIINALDKSKYEIIPIGITPQGKWLSSSEALNLLKSGRLLDRVPEKIILPDPTYKSLVALNGRSPDGDIEAASLDVVFIALHGTFGEDGTVQGLLDLADIPYVGAGVLGSAVAMDKIVAKQLLRGAGLPVTNDFWFVWKLFARRRKNTIAAIEKTIGYPCFVKPANLGSSIGISKVHDRRELEDAIALAGQYDWKVLVEESIEQAREIEVSVLGNDDPKASVPGEIIPSNEFYDYDAKYVDGKSKAIIPAELPSSVVEKIQEHAIRGFKVLDCAGMARVDFLVKRRTNKIILNEINTIPGFTSISMYPKLWQASGISYSKLLDKLIELALERHAEKGRLRLTYKPKSDWFR